MNEFIIVPGVSLWTLNPMNHALRNDYISDLLGMSVSFLPRFYKTFNNCKVLSGFVSRSKCDKDDMFSEYFSTGRGIILSIPNVGDAVLMEGLRKILEPLRSFTIIIQDDFLMILRTDESPNNYIKTLNDDKLITVYANEK